MTYEWYADVFVANSLCMDFCAMCMAGIILNVAVSWKKCLLGCVSSTVISVLLLFLIPSGLFYCLLLYGIVHPVITWIVFGGTGRTGYFRALFTIYIVLTFAGGVQNWIFSVTEGTALQTVVCGVMATAGFAGYQIRYKVMRQVCRVELWMDSKKIVVWAYYDSGNLLRDPETGAPVSVLAQEVFDTLETDPVRKREIPYRTVSQNGRMEIICFDRMDIFWKGGKREIYRPEIGLQKGPLIQHPEVHMLLHASCLP